MPSESAPSSTQFCSLGEAVAVDAAVVEREDALGGSENAHVLRHGDDLLE